MGLQIGEVFKDRCFLTVVATGSPADGLIDVTCVIIDEVGNRAAGVVTEESDGWYTCPFTPDAAGTWATEWHKTAGADDYVFHYPYKEFLCGAGQEEDIHTDVGTAIANIGTVDTVVDAVKVRTDHLEITKAFFSPSLIAATVDTSHTDIALGTVTLPNIAGTIVHVYAGIKFRMVENTNVAANKLNGAQEIQVDTVDAINFVDHQFGVAASTREGGDCIIGYTDMVATVDIFNHAYDFLWDEPLSEVDSLVFNDVQVFLIVSYY
jgi:hypothetical protein